MTNAVGVGTKYPLGGPQLGLSAREERHQCLIRSAYSFRERMRSSGMLKDILHMNVAGYWLRRKRLINT
jgi:hypothetical protein